MIPTVVPAYAAVCAFIFLALSVRVVRARRRARVPLGDGGVPAVRRAARVHGNFAEYVPLALLLLAFAEVQGYPAWLVHVLGVALVGGRLVHAVGVSREDEDYRFRVTGMALTFAVIAVAAALNLVGALAGDRA